MFWSLLNKIDTKEWLFYNIKSMPIILLFFFLRCTSQGSGLMTHCPCPCPYRRGQKNFTEMTPIRRGGVSYVQGVLVKWAEQPALSRVSGKTPGSWVVTMRRISSIRLHGRQTSAPRLVFSHTRPPQGWFWLC